MRRLWRQIVVWIIIEALCFAQIGWASDFKSVSRLEGFQNREGFLTRQEFEKRWERASAQIKHVRIDSEAVETINSGIIPINKADLLVEPVMEEPESIPGKFPIISLFPFGWYGWTDQQRADWLRDAIASGDPDRIARAQEIYASLSRDEQKALLLILGDEYYPTAATQLLRGLDSATRNELFVWLAQQDPTVASRILAHWPTGVDNPEVMGIFRALLEAEAQLAGQVLGELLKDDVRAYMAGVIFGNLSTDEQVRIINALMDYSSGALPNPQSQGYALANQIFQSLDYDRQLSLLTRLSEPEYFLTAINLLSNLDEQTHNSLFDDLIEAGGFWHDLTDVYGYFPAREIFKDLLDNWKAYAGIGIWVSPNSYPGVWMMAQQSAGALGFKPATLAADFVPPDTTRPWVLPFWDDVVRKYGYDAAKRIYEDVLAHWSEYVQGIGDIDTNTKEGWVSFYSALVGKSVENLGITTIVEFISQLYADYGMELSDEALAEWKDILSQRISREFVEQLFAEGASEQELITQAKKEVIKNTEIQLLINFVNQAPNYEDIPADGVARAKAGRALVLAYLVKAGYTEYFDELNAWIKEAMNGLPTTKEEWETTGFWHLCAAYQLGFAAWLVWDKLDENTQNSVRAIVTICADILFERLEKIKNSPDEIDPWFGTTYQEAFSNWEGNSRAEENAMCSIILALAANMFSDDSRAENWDKGARVFAFHVFTTGETDDIMGLYSKNLPDNYLMQNHEGINPIYGIGTMGNLGMAAQLYVLAGKEIPSEFQHNAVNVFNAFQPYIDENYQLTLGLGSIADTYGDGKDDWGTDVTRLSLAYAYYDYIEGKDTLYDLIMFESANYSGAPYSRLNNRQSAGIGYWIDSMLATSHVINLLGWR